MWPARFLFGASDESIRAPRSTSAHPRMYRRPCPAAARDGVRCLSGSGRRGIGKGCPRAAGIHSIQSGNLHQRRGCRYNWWDPCYIVEKLDPTTYNESLVQLGNVTINAHRSVTTLDYTTRGFSMMVLSPTMAPFLRTFAAPSRATWSTGISTRWGFRRRMARFISTQSIRSFLGVFSPKWSQQLGPTRSAPMRR